MSSPSTAALVLLGSVLDELTKASKPISSSDIANDTEAFREHWRALGAATVLLGATARELGRPELHERAMKILGVKA